MRERRGVAVLAVLGLVAVTVGAVVALAWAVIFEKGDTAVLGTIASIGVGSLASLAGVKAASASRKSTDDSDNNEGK